MKSALSFRAHGRMTWAKKEQDRQARAGRLPVKVFLCPDCRAKVAASVCMSHAARCPAKK
jgi:uncharacterized protein YlaI